MQVTTGPGGKLEHADGRPGPAGGAARSIAPGSGLPCEGLLDGGLASEGVEGIPERFAGWEDELDGYPTAAKYALWDRDALEVKLRFVERLRDDIAREARALLDGLPRARAAHRCFFCSSCQIGR